MSDKRILGAVLLGAVLAVGCGDANTTADASNRSITAVAPSLAKLTAGSATISGRPPNPTGERFLNNGAYIPIYNWDHGPNEILYGLTPVAAKIWPAEGDPNTFGTFYIIAYPFGTTATLQCYDYPQETCPDHGPVIAGGAIQLAPDVYGDGVLGHDHMSPPANDPDFKVKLNPILVLFTSKAAAATNHPTTRGEVAALVASGQAVQYFLPQFSFVNQLTTFAEYNRSAVWICAAYTLCPHP